MARTYRGRLNYPAGALSELLDVIWCFFRPLAPGDDAAMPDFVICCNEWDLPFAEHTPSILPKKGSLVGWPTDAEQP